MLFKTRIMSGRINSRIEDERMDKRANERLTQPASSLIPHPSSLLSPLLPNLRRALRGDVEARLLLLEACRRTRCALRQRRERARIERFNKSVARLSIKFARLTPTELLAHFRSRSSPKFLPGLAASL